MKYQPPFGPNWPNVDNPNAPYINGNPPAGIKGSIPPAQSWEWPMREIVHTIEKGGYVPADPHMDDPVHGAADPDDPNLFQLTQGVRRALYAWGVDTGSANSISVTLDPPLKAYAQGLEIRVLVAEDNSGSATIRVNGLSTQQIVKKDGSQLYAGELRQGGVAVLVHDGSNFQLVSGAAGSTTITDGWYNGADYVVDVGTPNHIVGTPLVAPTAYAAGQGFCVLVKNRNTGPVDINLNALGVRPLKHPTGQQMQIGDIVPNMLIYIRYDGADFYMLSPIHMAIIYEVLTFVVGPNASPAADFPDLIQALIWAGRRRIGITGAVTFRLQGQTTGSPVVHNYAAPLQIKHPDGDRLTISGWGINFRPTRPHFAVTGWNPFGDAATNVAMLKTAFQSELHFTATSGLVFDGTRCNLTNLLVTGPGMAVNSCSGIAAATTASFVVSGIAQNGITMGNQAQMNIETAADWPAIYSCGGDAIYMYGSSNANMNKLFIYYVGGWGVNATSSATFRADGGNVSNAAGGFSITVNSDANVSNSKFAAAEPKTLRYRLLHGCARYRLRQQAWQG